jgi:hypothetical protein
MLGCSGGFKPLVPPSVPGCSDLGGRCSGGGADSGEGEEERQQSSLCAGGDAAGAVAGGVGAGSPGDSDGSSCTDGLFFEEQEIA